jgi:hypothetical protein
MTRIRRINVSQVEGDDADSTNSDEIRPFGETAFYLDDNGKLTLMMFDGVRTHLKSKVLAQGVLYGSNADSSDGNNYDTIKLIPDATLYNNGSDQYIVVDPTGGEPGHIHLRAGGTQDASTADLYLGGEETFVRVSDTSGIITVRTTNVGDPNITMNWSFQPDGNLYFPGIGNNRIGESEPGLGVSSSDAVVLQSNNNGESKEWLFGTNGSLTFPDTTVQTTAYVSDKTTGTWTVIPGNNTYSFTVPVNGVYQLWVRGNIPNGIISYTATAAVTNSNVPVLGTQYAWNYTGAGNPILFTSIPDQFIGTEGSISTATPSVGTATNTFVFGIDNSTVENVTVDWGYTKIS